MSEYKSSSNVRERIKIKKPSMYKVLMMNDDYSTMEFVIQVLMLYFNKGEEVAYKIMMDIHTKGKGLCGIYTREIAETKIEKVHQLAAKKGFPLKCLMEKSE